MTPEMKAKLDSFDTTLKQELSRYMQTNEQIRSLMLVNEQRMKGIVEMTSRMGQLVTGQAMHIAPPPKKPAEPAPSASTPVEAPTGVLAAIAATERAADAEVAPSVLLPWEEYPETGNQNND